MPLLSYFPQAEPPPPGSNPEPGGWAWGQTPCPRSSQCPVLLCAPSALETEVARYSSCLYSPRFINKDNGLDGWMDGWMRGRVGGGSCSMTLVTGTLYSSRGLDLQ